MWPGSSENGLPSSVIPPTIGLRTSHPDSVAVSATAAHTAPSGGLEYQNTPGTADRARPFQWYAYPILGTPFATHSGRIETTLWDLYSDPVSHFCLLANIIVSMKFGNAEMTHDAVAKRSRLLEMIFQAAPLLYLSAFLDGLLTRLILDHLFCVRQ